MNGNSYTNHTRYVVSCITVLGVLCLFGGTILIFKGYSGDLVIGGGLAAISGLIGMLSNRQPTVAHEPSPPVAEPPPRE